MIIKTIAFTDLLKQELPAFARTVIEVVERHDPEALKIKEVYDLLVAQNANMDLLTQPFGSHPLTTTLKPVRRKCLKYAQLIVYKMGVIMELNAGQLTQEMIDTNALVKRYLHRLDLCKREQHLITRLNDFFVQLGSDAGIQESFTTFEMTGDLSNLELAFSKRSGLLTKRTQLISTRPILMADEIGAPIIKGLKDLFKHVEVSAAINPELDYTGLINELNEIIRLQRNSISMRKLFNKRKAEELKALKNESNNESGIPEVMSAPMIMSVSEDMPEENVFEERLDEQLEQKKTVAKSSKSMQLPDEKNEA